MSLNLLFRVIGLVAFALLTIGFGAVGSASMLGLGLFCWLLSETV